MIDACTTPLTVDLTGLRVAISAGAGGIGRVMADGFAACGARVFLCDVDAEMLAACPHPNMRADMADAPACEDFVNAAVAHLGGLDVMVNNAGIAGPTARVEDVRTEDLERTMAIDIESFFHCARRAVPALRATGKGGAIINLSSAAGRFGFPLRSPYAAAKWGVIGFTKSLAIELGPEGIRVNAILPGLVAGDRIRRVIEAKAQAEGTPFRDKEAQLLAANSLRTYVTQHDIANMALYLCSPFGRSISGQALAIDGDMQFLA
ncbi:SDR family oxidoreductase [Plastoroseomonas arctica]|uniref:SDR family oxidoreductase n=1 Tax=Plastoroseomonas arctica TaxID=1509237 RepID=A0AAF1JYK8_9PROT|nr:SDR family oxidoreductase [Plastoroseomonas arctica]MBR0656050.1 SDR family oxidoreductase [Plastoroseomonas arctica]